MFASLQSSGTSLVDQGCWYMMAWLSPLPAPQLGVLKRVKSKLTAPERFGLFNDMLGRGPWNKTLEGRRAHENWLIFKNHFLQAQEWCYSSKRSQFKMLGRLHCWRRSSWPNTHKKENYKGWKQGQETYEEKRYCQGRNNLSWSPN